MNKLILGVKIQQISVKLALSSTGDEDISCTVYTSLYTVPVFVMG